MGDVGEIWVALEGHRSWVGEGGKRCLKILGGGRAHEVISPGYSVHPGQTLAPAPCPVPSTVIWTELGSVMSVDGRAAWEGHGEPGEGSEVMKWLETGAQRQGQGNGTGSTWTGTGWGWGLGKEPFLATKGSGLSSALARPGWNQSHVWLCSWGWTVSSQCIGNPRARQRCIFRLSSQLPPSVNESGQDSQPSQLTDPEALLAFENDSWVVCFRQLAWGWWRQSWTGGEPV